MSGPGFIDECEVGFEHIESGIALVRVSGVVDGKAAPHVERRFRLALRDTGVRPSHVLLDLSGIVFLDGGGLDTLLCLQNMLESDDCTIELLKPTPEVLRLLHEAHLDGESGSVPAAGNTG